MRKRFLNILFWSVISAAFIGPGTVTTAAKAGAVYQYQLLWALFFSTIACLVLQEAAARLTLVSGLNLGEAIRWRYKDTSLFVWVVPYNLFLGSGMAGEKQTLKEMRFGLSVAVILGGLISMAVLVVGTAVQGAFSYEGLVAVLRISTGRWAVIIFGIGMLAAGFTSAVTAPLASASQQNPCSMKKAGPPGEKENDGLSSPG